VGNLGGDGTRRFRFVSRIRCSNQLDFVDNWANGAAVLNHFGNAPMQQGSGRRLDRRPLLHVERFGAGGLAARIGRDLVDPRFGLAQ